MTEGLRRRAGAIITSGENILLIKRHLETRDPPTYWLFPGGGVEEGESVEDACIREVREELGLEVRLGRLVANVVFGSPDPRSLQSYFLADVIGGELGTGEWPIEGVQTESGWYQPEWVSASDLQKMHVVPAPLADIVREAFRTGWPSAPVDLEE